MTNKPAGFFLRLLAWAVEKNLFLLPFAYIFSNIASSQNLNSFFSGIIGFITLAIFVLLLGTIYNLAFTYYLGGVLGKLITGLKIAKEDGSKLPFNMVAFRQLISYRFSALVFGLGYLSIFKDSQKRAWHDKTVGSNVFISRSLWPLGILVLLILLGLNGYFVNLSANHFSKGPLGGQISSLISEFKSSNSAQSLEISPQILQDQKNVYNLLSQDKLAEASQSAQMMLAESKTQNDKALALQVTGEVYAANLDYKDARLYFNEALKLSDKLPGAYIGLATADITDKNYQSAIDNAQKAIALAPSRTDYNYTLGLAYFGKGDKTNAIKYIQIAADKNPNVTEYKQTLDTLEASPSPTPITKTTQTTQGLGYTTADINSLVSDLTQADKDTQTLKDGYLGHSAYNQSTVNQILSIISQRKVLAQGLLNKMGKGEALNQTDINNWNLYGSLSRQQDNLVKSLENSNGGY